MKSRLPIWLSGIATALAGVSAAYFFAAALATASLRFGYCGPTSLSAKEQYCRIGTQLLYLSYALAGLTLALAITTWWLHRRRRQGANNSFNPMPLRGTG